MFVSCFSRVKHNRLTWLRMRMILLQNQEAGGWYDVGEIGDPTGFPPLMTLNRLHPILGMWV